MKIKVCGLADADNVGAISECKPDYAGFIFYPHSKRYVVTSKLFRDTVANLTNVQKVGVFVNANIVDIEKAVAQYKLDAIQLHGDETPDACREVAKIMPVIKAFQVDAQMDFSGLSEYANHCSYFLFDTASQQYGGSGQTFDWKLLDKYKFRIPFFLSGGIDLAQVAAIKQIAHPALWGVDINSRFETSPGIKDIKRIKTFINEIRH